MPLNYLDIAFALIFIILMVRGAMRGFIAEVAGLVGLALGFFLAYSYSTSFSNWLLQYIAPQAAAAVAFVLLFLGGMILVGILAHVLENILHFSFAGWLNHLAGAAAGLVKGYILAAALAYLVQFLIPHLDFVRNSLLMQPMLDSIRYMIVTMDFSLPMP